MFDSCADIFLFSDSKRMRAEAPPRSLGGQLGVAGWGEASAQVLEDVKGQAAHKRDDGHLPQERHCGDEVHVWREPRGE